MKEEQASVWRWSLRLQMTHSFEYNYFEKTHFLRNGHLSQSHLLNLSQLFVLSFVRLWACWSDVLSIIIIQRTSAGSSASPCRRSQDSNSSVLHTGQEPCTTVWWKCLWCLLSRSRASREISGSAVSKTLNVRKKVHLQICSVSVLV